jgi:hypothetical protein
MSTTSVAVSLSADGNGQVLLFPYYFTSNTGDAFSSLINIVNTTPDIKAIRVRFREGVEGASVGDVNVYLDGYDVWTIAVLATEDGAGIGTFDKSCTSPSVSSDPAKLTLLYDNNYVDGPGDVSLARTREGYIEVIEMGDYGPATTATGPVPAGVVHVAGVPRNCAVVATDTGAGAQAPTGGLIGSAMLISVTGSVDYYYQATALNGFSDRPGGFGSISQDSPSLSDAHPPFSIVRDGAGRTIRSDWSRGIDAVSAALMSDSVQGEYVLEPSTLSQTNWVVTMPTKWYYVHHGLDPRAPFVHAYTEQGDCEMIEHPLNYPLVSVTDFGVFTRDGERYNNSFGEPIPPYGAFCFVATLLPFNGTKIFPWANQYQASQRPSGDSSVPTSIDAVSASGWARIALYPAYDLGDDEDGDLVHQMTSGATTIVNVDGSVQSRASMTYIGLPVAGFAASSYYNGTLTDSNGRNVLSTYVAGTTLRTRVQVQ